MLGKRGMKKSPWPTIFLSETYLQYYKRYIYRENYGSNKSIIFFYLQVLYQMNFCSYVLGHFHSLKAFMTIKFSVKKNIYIESELKIQEKE